MLIEDERHAFKIELDVTPGDGEDWTTPERQGRTAGWRGEHK